MCSSNVRGLAMLTREEWDSDSSESSVDQALHFKGKTEPEDENEVMYMSRKSNSFHEGSLDGELYSPSEQAKPASESGPSSYARSAAKSATMWPTTTYTTGPSPATPQCKLLLLPRQKVQHYQKHPEALSVLPVSKVQECGDEELLEDKKIKAQLKRLKAQSLQRHRVKKHRRGDKKEDEAANNSMPFSESKTNEHHHHHTTTALPSSQVDGYVKPLKHIIHPYAYPKVHETQQQQPLHPFFHHNTNEKPTNPQEIYSRSLNKAFLSQTSYFSGMQSSYKALEATAKFPLSEPYSLDSIHIHHNTADISSSADNLELLKCNKNTENSNLQDLLLKFSYPMDLSSHNTFLSHFSRKSLPLSDLREIGFSEFESNVVCNIMIVEDEASKMIPFRPEAMAAMIKGSSQRTPLSSEICLEGYIVCMRRIIQLAFKLDFFASFSIEDQKALLLANTDMIVNIRTARFLQPGLNLENQIAVISGESSSELSHSQAIEFYQIFNSPWAYTYEHEKLYHELLKKLFDLQMDEISTVLISMMSLFSTTNVILKEKTRAIQAQEFFTDLLKKYITSNPG
ncbi:Nuclear receptor, partial [Caligus rogercresseyi]